MSNILDKLEKLANPDASDDFYDRINRNNRLANFTTLSKNWNVKYHELGTTVPAAATMFGLCIIDWDGTYLNRNPQLSTEDLQIPFQYIEKIPEWSKKANYADLGSDIIGRFEPIQSYSNSSPMAFQLELKYHAEALDNVEASTHWTLENIEKYTKKLQAMVFPIYTNGFAPPPKLKLNIGNLWRNFPIIIENVNVKNDPPYHIETGLSMFRTITLDCKSSYPMWQGISSDKVFVTSMGDNIFAYEEINTRVLQKGSSKATTRLSFKGMS